jgi:hypothetical protein
LPVFRVPAAIHCLIMKAHGVHALA